MPVSKELYALLALIVLYVSYRVFQTVLYRRSSYYQVTRRKFSELDSGSIGEYLIYVRLKALEKTGGKFLFNLYIPKLDGGTTEIDIVLIHPRGLFVLESKNFSGWIFGNEAHDFWTQTLPSSRGVAAHKERFFNPIRQNAKHVVNLRRVVDVASPIWSIIVFSDRCDFKDLTVSEDKSYRVLKLADLSVALKQLMNQAGKEHFTQIDVEHLYESLFPYSQADQVTKERHARTASQRLRNH
jgi:hypothetical protein